MQPSNMKKKRSVTKVSEKDFADPKNTNYALTHQEQDSEGDLETKIYKASYCDQIGAQYGDWAISEIQFKHEKVKFYDLLNGCIVFQNIQKWGI